MAGLPIDDEHAPLYSVGQVAAMVQVPQSFLRRLDDQNVVSPQRSAGGQRRYSRHEIDLIQRLAGLVDEGLPMAAAARVLELERELADVRRRLDDLRRRTGGDRTGR